MGPDLSVEIAGLRLKNPTMLAAGIRGLSASSLRRAAEAGAGAVVTKSIGLKPRSGYPNPVIVDVGVGLINALGLPNPGVEEYVREIRGAKADDVVVVGSVYGSSPEEFVKVSERVEEAGADAIELNVSCPHVKGAGMQLGQDPRLLRRVVRAVKSSVEVPIFTKLTPNITDIVEVACVAEEAGTDAITAINTVRAMAIDIETGRPILANRVGGLSGPAIKPIAVRCVYEISRSVDVPVISCGGVDDWGDAVEFMLAGAAAVQIGSAIGYKGLNVFEEVVAGIQKYLERKGCGSVGEIVGLSHRH
ncbi:MAG: dihydroorotate dehydrogenase [Candidatus Bathyarchaeia archaeon]